MTVQGQVAGAFNSTRWETKSHTDLDMGIIWLRIFNAHC